MNQKVIIFDKTTRAPKLIGFVNINASRQASELLGESASVERVKGEGYCLVRKSDAHLRYLWNQPIVTPQVI